MDVCCFSKHLQLILLPLLMLGHRDHWKSLGCYTDGTSRMIGRDVKDMHGKPDLHDIAGGVLSLGVGLQQAELQDVSGRPQEEQILVKFKWISAGFLPETDLVISFCELSIYLKCALPLYSVSGQVLYES